MKKQKTGTIETRISRFLFAYRSTPHSTTNVSPAMLMFNRQLRSHLDLLKPDIEPTVLNRQFHQQLNHNLHARDRQFQIGDNVFIENFGHGSKWIDGTVKEIRGLFTYMIELTDGRVVQRHVDHIRSQTCESSSAPDDALPDQDLLFDPLLNNDEPQPNQSQPPTEQQPDVSVQSSSCV